MGLLKAGMPPVRFTPNAALGCYCDGAGWYIEAGTMTKCACGVAGKSSDERRLNSELDVLAHKTFQNFRLDRPFTASQERSVKYQASMLEMAYNRASNFSRKPEGWLYIWGPPGTGKSHLAAAIANFLSSCRWSVVYRSMPAVMDMLRDGVKAGEVSRTLALLESADLLVLDDIGADGKPTDWAEGRIFSLINARVDRPTVFTSNFDVHELPYHERITDRLNAARRAWVHASSMRGQKPAAPASAGKAGDLFTE